MLYITTIYFTTRLRVRQKFGIFSKFKDPTTWITIYRNRAIITICPGARAAGKDLFRQAEAERRGLNGQVQQDYNL